MLSISKSGCRPEEAISTNESTTIGELKHVVSQRFRPSIRDQILVSQGKILTDNMTLAEFKQSFGSSRVDLITRYRKEKDDHDPLKAMSAEEFEYFAHLFAKVWKQIRGRSESHNEVRPLR